MVRKLDELGLVTHERYRGVRLTESGTRLALEMIRHHRLLELYLAESLGVPWDRVHQEAEVLEHVLSEELEALIAAKLGHPTHDPHGDPIPSADLVIAEERTECLTALEPGAEAVVVRISDAEPEMLRYLAEREIAARHAACAWSTSSRSAARCSSRSRARRTRSAASSPPRCGCAHEPADADRRPRRAAAPARRPSRRTRRCRRCAPAARCAASSALLGPAFVAAVAYIDPGNFATNIAGGAKYGYMLLWVIVAANLMAMLVQYLSAKTGIATGQEPARAVPRALQAPVTWGLWVQAEAIAIATDIAEFVGAAIALNLLFGVPPFVAGLMTAVVAFAILELQTRGHRKFELAITGFLGDRLPRLHVRPAAGRRGPGRLRGRPRPALRRHRQRAAGRRHPRRDRDAARRLPALGADVEPDQAARTSPRRRELLRFQRLDVVARDGPRGDHQHHDARRRRAALPRLAAAPTSTRSRAPTPASSALLGGGAALAFAVALLASGLSSSSVGTFAGQVVMQGFINRRIPLFLRRAITMAPSLVILAIGVDPSTTLVISQVVLSLRHPVRARADGAADAPRRTSWARS